MDQSSPLVFSAVSKRRNHNGQTGAQVSAKPSCSTKGERSVLFSLMIDSGLWFLLNTDLTFSGWSVIRMWFLNVLIHYSVCATTIEVYEL